MSQYTMPMLVMNLGGEMVYILEQRLKAQTIPDHKAQTVLHDVVKTLCNPKFLEEVFRPQESFSHTSMRGIFNRLAHSSIMRLSEASMDKLFDLMTMGFKHQSISSVYPGELFKITMNHINYIKAICVKNAPLAAMVDDLESRLTKLYGNMSFASATALKQGILLFFQDRRVKVSLFLQDGLQKTDGELVVSASGPLPSYINVPGKIRYFDKAGKETSSTTADIPAMPLVVQIKGEYETQLGKNLYAKDRPKPSNDIPTPQPLPAGIADAPAPSAQKPAVDTGKAAREELEGLKTMMGSGDDAAGFKITLSFVDAGELPEPTTKMVIPKSEPAAVPTEVFDARQRKQDDRLSQILDSLSIDDTHAATKKETTEKPKDAGEDLLDLLDSSTA